MADMRLIVAGAGGRMGRTLIQAIAAMDGVVLAGAVEAAGSAVIGRDAGELAGLGNNGIAVTAEVEPLLAKADGFIDFTVPAATRVFAELAARKGCVHIIGTTGLSDEDDALIAEAAKRAIVVKSGNMSLGVNLLAALVQARGEDARCGFRHRDFRDASQPEGRCAVRHRADARPGRRRRAAASISRNIRRAAATATPARAAPGDIGFASLRGGTVVGEHSVIFAGPPSASSSPTRPRIA